jgi:L-alanine-DL-glutamate epimerase-like enolase superfamily enzyme
MDSIGVDEILHQVFPQPVILASIEAFRYDGHYLVRATSREGAVGVVTVNNRLAYLWPLLREFVIPYFTGQDVRDIGMLLDGVYTYKSAYKLAGIAFWNPVAYAELAVLDLLGRLADRPAGALLGQVIRSEIPIYLSSMHRDTTPEEEVGWLGARLAETHATAVKFKIGGRMSHNADAFPGRTDRLVPLARKTFGDDVTIYVDANGSYDAAHAIEVGALLTDHGVAFLEEPCPWQEYRQTKQVADALDLPVAGGEQDSSLSLFEWMIDDRVVDLVQPDMMYNGGLIRALRVAEMAAGVNMLVMPHSPKIGAEGAAVIQFGSVAPNLGPHQEWHGRAVTFPSWYTPAFEIRQGRVAVPTGPGLGVEYDPEIWERAERLV